jgi:cyclohexanone monooxygenase
MADDAMNLERGLGFDADVLREKYQQERAKRLRDDGRKQYVDVSGAFQHYAEDDPNVEPGFTREPVADEVEVAILGGGFSGLLAAARLREAGIKDIRIIEAGGDFGGTWYWNRYPGAQCDVESYSYIPLLEETGYIPKEKYSSADEIFEHAQRIGHQYSLYDITLFQTRVRDLRWDESIKRWIVNTNRGDDIRARFVVVAMGSTSQPKLPGIPGIEDFEGRSFHISRWDFDYTGGDTHGNLHKLGDKRVAIIGTGASGIQAVPALGRDAKHLYVFQRTPTSIVGPRGNKPTDPDWAASLKPGWQRERRDNFSDLAAGRPYEVDLVNDGWSEIVLSLRPSGATEVSPEEMARQVELADFKKMNEVRARVDAIVKDPAVAELLKPWYRLFCKRPTFSDGYLPTFNRPNVTLVDTSPAKGVEKITKNAVVANGIEYEVDCIIYASGFQTSAEFGQRVGFPMYGRDGVSLDDYWAKGARTFHGHSTHGFPNWFFIGLLQNANSVNLIANFDDQARHLAYIIKEVMDRGALAVEPSVEAVDDWVKTIRETSTGWAFFESCTPGFYNNEGGAPAGSLFWESYAPGPIAFNALLAEWRATGHLPGLTLQH